MREPMLHILAPSRRDEVAAIIGDLPALRALRDALDCALASGAGGTVACQSDGASYYLAVALQPDMRAVYTSYADDPRQRRALREKTPMRFVPNFWMALSKAMAAHGTMRLHAQEEYVRPAAEIRQSTID